MVVKSLFAGWFAVAVLASRPSAQGAGPSGLEVGKPAPAATWQSWQRGEPVELGAHGAPACTVFAFYTCGQGRDVWLTADGDYLGDLQRRLRDRDLRVVVVVGAAGAALGPGWSPCSVAVDAELATTRAWFGDAADGDPEAWNVVVCDRDGAVAFVGRPESGLCDAIAAVLDGRAAGPGADLCLARRDLLSQFESEQAGQSRALIEQLVTRSPRDGRLLGLWHLAASRQPDGGEAAEKVRQLAVDRLANEPRPLAAFVDLALRGGSMPQAAAALLAAALVPATALCPDDVFVQLAYLRALVCAGKVREVGRHAARMPRLVTAAPALCLEFAEILSQDRAAVAHRALAEQALGRARELEAEPRLIAATSYQVLLACAADAAGAKACCAAFAEELGSRVSINNACWYLMTELPTLGRYDGFALALAERMLDDRRNMDGFEFDTAALAMHRARRHQEAAELQELAIEKDGRGNPDYGERLARYRAAAEAARPK